MSKKKPLPTNPGKQIPIGTRVEIIRPHSLWSGLKGKVEHFGGTLHHVRVSYPGKKETFLVAARADEMKVLP